MAFLIHHIKTLVHTENEPADFIAGMDLNRMQSVDHAYLLIEGDTILDFGKEEVDTIDRLTQRYPGLEIYDANGGHVFPSWCDAHTHLVFAGSREKEFEDRISGLSYQEIAQRGGGILNSARKLRNATEQELFEDAASRIYEMIRMGTGAIEIKSGYGLDEESELKILRVIQRLKQEMPVAIRATFLGAHTVPEEFRNDKAGYIRLLTNRIMPRIAEEKLADYCDVFCESGYFTKTETIAILEAGLKYGMSPKVHAEQLSHHGGIEAGVTCGAVSVDHLEYANENDMALLAGSKTMPVLLPGAQLFLGLQHPPVKQMLEAGLPIALSTDFNPGSSPTGNMNQMVSLACILYKMTPSASIIAATSNSAYAMGLSRTYGSIAKGKKANVFITRPIPSTAYLPYYFGQVVIEKIILNGKIIN